MGLLNPQVDLVLLRRDASPLPPEVERGIRLQHGVQLMLHRVVGSARPEDRCRWDTIARARNEGKWRGTAPWLMFLDDDVVLAPGCVSAMVDELNRRPLYGAVAADYLGERCEHQCAGHVAMGATLFRREALDQIRFSWREQRCECQCCCDDLRRRCWAIDYCRSARARHLPQGNVGENLLAEADERRLAERAGMPGHDQHAGAPDPSVCLVVCYFGAPPGWIERYLISCAHNPSIHFLIVTDQENFPAVPANVRVRRLSRSAFCALATNKTGVQIDLSSPRKLCDFKPAYGHIFEDFLDGWDYWGYTDLDVIYGDLRRFLSAARLHEHDVFTARREFLVGHFTLMRNSHPMRTLYRQSTDFQTTLQSRQMLSFDECGKLWCQRLQGKPLSDRASCDSMTHVVHRMMAADKLNACFSPAVIEWPELGTPAWRLRWQAGRLWVVDQHREAMYFHFHAFKQRRGYRKPGWFEPAADFEMSPRGFERVWGPIGTAGHAAVSETRSAAAPPVANPNISSISAANAKSTASAALNGDLGCSRINNTLRTQNPVCLAATALFTFSRRD